MCTQNVLVYCAGVCIAFTFHGIWNHDCIERRSRSRVDAMRKCPFWKWVSPIKYRITYLCAEIPKQWETVYGTAAIPFTQWQYPFLYISGSYQVFIQYTHRLTQTTGHGVARLRSSLPLFTNNNMYGSLKWNDKYKYRPKQQYTSTFWVICVCVYV